MKKLGALLVALLFGLTALTACGGGGGGSTTLNGKYLLESMTVEGETMEMAALSAMGLDPSIFFLEFTDGENCVLSMAEEVTECTYTVKGNTITITVDGEPADATMNGNTITLDSPQNDASMVFTKP